APRVLSAALAGAALAFAGLLMQGLFRNPLASPDVLGASSGASLGAVLCIAGGWAARSIWPVPACAFLGALAVVTVVYALASSHGDTPLATLLLAGVAVSAFTGAMTSLVLSLAASHSWEAAREIVLWTMGGLDARQWKHVLAAAPPMAVSIAAGLVFTRDLNIMLLGEEQARTLGVDTRRLKVCVLAAASLATGAAVAIGGLIAFVGLIVPHLLRLLLGPDHRRLGPACVFGGAVFLVAMDTAARTIGPTEIRLGILTGALGAPFFLFLLASQRNKALHL
ncbi:MAG TPA: iron chelate uptake ABC transporter family permease subunit, partial [Candidatus Brocadiia bacterium]|nr:iron chelate uptake ABC transporter family permease subunit [Candidatus Brocadiia bacterium]